MAYLYFPKDENLRALTDKEVFEIEVGIANAKNVDLPWGFQDNILDLVFYEDKGMDLENGVMGYTKFMSSKILLSPGVVEGLMWKDNNSIPNNETSMGTIIHELTHRKQMQWLGGFAWLFLNIPGIDRLTIECWARENESAAAAGLSELYSNIRAVGNSYN